MIVINCHPEGVIDEGSNEAEAKGQGHAIPTSYGAGWTALTALFISFIYLLCTSTT